MDELFQTPVLTELTLWPRPAASTHTQQTPLGSGAVAQTRAGTPWHAGNATVEEGLSDKVPGEQKTETLMRKTKISAQNVPTLGCSRGRRENIHCPSSDRNWKPAEGLDTRRRWLNGGLFTLITAHVPQPAPWATLCSKCVTYQRARSSRQASTEVRSIIIHRRRGNVQVANEGVRAIY